MKWKLPPLAGSILVACGEMTKRKIPSARSNVGWAWEFLRRNKGYRQAFYYWVEGTRLPTRAPKELASALRDTLEECGLWADRFRPWLEAALATGRPLIDLSYFVRTPQGWTPSLLPPVKTERQLTALLNHSTTMLMPQADRYLDPMNWCLNRWLDPSTNHPEACLLDAFDRESLIKITSIAGRAKEARALATLGLLTFAQYGGAYELSPFVEFSPLQYGDGKSGRSTLQIEIDLSAPQQPLFDALLEWTTRIKKGLMTGRRGEQPEFEEVRKSNYADTYSRYLDLLDALDHSTTISEAYASVKEKWKTASSDTLGKNRKEAEFLRDHGYRHLAFLD